METEDVPQAPFQLGQKVTVIKPPASVLRDAAALVGRTGRLVCLNHQSRAVWAMMDEPIPQECVNNRHRMRFDSRRDWVLLKPEECETTVSLPEWV